MEAFRSLYTNIRLLSSKKPIYSLAITSAIPGDGNLLAAKADGTILVVGIEKTDRSLVMKAFDGLKIAGASILGIVANGLKTEATKSYTSYRRN